MTINHPEGLYTINYDEKRSVVYEAPVGLWKKEQYMEYHSQYENKIGPALAGKPWAICTDLRNYKISDLADGMAIHAEWLVKNNVKFGATIVSSAIVKMQINRAFSPSFPQQAFLTMEEADEWIKLNGF